MCLLWCAAVGIASVFAIVLWVSSLSALLAAELGAWHPVLTVGVLDVGPKPFASLGEAGGWERGLSSLHSARSEIYGKNVSQPLLPISMWVFSHSSDM